MASKKKLERQIGQMVWLTKQEAMTYVDKCEAIFDEDWRPFLNRYDNGGTVMYSKQQIDEFMEYRMAVAGLPFNQWKPRTASNNQ